MQGFEKRKDGRRYCMIEPFYKNILPQEMEVTLNEGILAC